MTELDTLTPGPSNGPPLPPKARDHLHGPLISAGAALLGALVGGLITAYVQFHLADKQNQAAVALLDKQNQAAIEAEKRRNTEAAEQRRRDKAEEIITLIEEIAPESIQLRRQMENDAEHAPVPVDADRALALVDLNFPDALQEARTFEYWNTCHMKELRLMANARYANHRLARDFDRASLDATLLAGDEVIAKILTELGVPYSRRSGVGPPTHCSAAAEQEAEQTSAAAEAEWRAAQRKQRAQTKH